MGRGRGRSRRLCRLRRGGYLLEAGRRVALFWNDEQRGILGTEPDIFVLDYPRPGMLTAILDFDGKALQILRFIEPEMQYHGILRIVNDQIFDAA